MQLRSVSYHDLDTSILHNTRFVSVVKPGVYKGFYIRVNVGNPALLDVTHGIDDTSVLVTVEGVRIEEDSEEMGVITVAPADTSFTRVDLMVAEYQWVPDNSVPMSYKIIRGKSQTDLTIDPVRPEPQNKYQVPLAWIIVRPRPAVGGSGQVVLEQKDVIHYPRGSGLESPSEVSTLKPIIDPTNRLRLYVFPGIYPSLDGTEVIEFDGGYSDEIDTSNLTVSGDERWFLYGISDDGAVGVAGESATSDVDPQIGSNVLPLCVGYAANRAGTIGMESLLDIRFPFSRRVAPQPEQDFYQDVLGNSVFQYVRIDDVSANSLLDLTTLLPSETDLTAEFQHGDTSLAFIYSGSTQPTTDVTIATKNILDGTPVTNVRHIMVLVDTDVTNLTFDYSTTSSTGGFIGQDLDPGTVQEIPGSASQLHIRFKIPATAFEGGATKKLFSYAVYMEFDEITLNDRVITSLGLDSIGLSIPNLICNGDFRRWSRPDSSGTTPDLNTRDKINYSISTLEIADREKIYAADGWQFTKLEFDSDKSIISRALWSRDVLGSLDETTHDYCLEWVGSAGSQPGAENNLEFRIPVIADYEGNYVTFSFDYRSQPREAVGIRLVFYERQSDGTLSVLDASETGPVATDGTLLVRSGITVSSKTFAIGCIIIFQQTTGASTVYVRRARAAIGDYRVLPFTRPSNADDLCRFYYERGTAYASSNVADGEEAGVSVHYGSRKHLGVAESAAVRVRQIPLASANRSSNILNLEYVGDENGFVAQGLSTGDQTIIDVDWEAEVIYPVS